MEPAASTFAVGLDAFCYFVAVLVDAVAVSVVHWQLLGLLVAVTIGAICSLLVLLLRDRVASASSGVVNSVGVSILSSEDFRLVSSPTHLVIVRMFFAAHDVGARHAC